MFLKLRSFALKFSLFICTRLALIIFESVFTYWCVVFLVKRNQISHSQVPLLWSCLSHFRIISNTTRRLISDLKLRLAYVRIWLLRAFSYSLESRILSARGMSLTILTLLNQDLDVSIILSWLVFGHECGILFFLLHLVFMHQTLLPRLHKGLVYINSCSIVPDCG